VTLFILIMLPNRNKNQERLKSYNRWTCRYPSSNVVLKHTTPLQFDVHGSPWFQLLRFLLGSIKLLLIACNAVTSIGWVKGCCAPLISSEDHQHKHETTYIPYVQALEWYIPITQRASEVSKFSEYPKLGIFVVCDYSALVGKHWIVEIVIERSKLTQGSNMNLEW